MRSKNCNTKDAAELCDYCGAELRRHESYVCDDCKGTFDNETIDTNTQPE